MSEMATNTERAADLIANATIPLGASVARGMDRAILAAQALADAGLLMPDLPPADEEEWENFGNVISLDGMHILPMIENDALTPDEARDIAYSLLAAADYAAQGQSNE